MSVMMVPERWKLLRLLDIGQVITGNTPSTEHEEYYGGIIPFIGPVDFRGQKYIDEAGKNVSELGLLQSRKIPKNTIMTVCIGSTIGKIAIAIKDSCTNQQINSLVCNNQFNSEYIFYAMSQYLQKQLDVEAGLQAVPIVNKSSFSKLLLPCPTRIAEQQKISTILSTLDRTIEATQKLIDKEKMVKKGLMADLLTNGIDDQGWGEKRLIDVVDKSDRYSFTGGPFGSDLKSSDYVEQGVRVLQLQNIGDGKFKNNDFVYTSEEKAEELKSCQIFPDEIIMSKMGDPVGRACLIPNIEPKYVMCSDGIRIAVNRKEYDNKFIYYTINHDTFRKSIERVALGSTRKRVGLTELKVLTFYVPSLLEQQKIAQILSAQDRKIETEETNLAKLQNLKKGLMGDLLSGDVRVKV